MPKTELFDNEEVLKKALWLFWEKGYNGTSITELENAMGIKRSSIYNSYGDKEALFLKAFALYKRMVVSKYNADLMVSKSPLAVLRKTFRDVVKDARNDTLHKGCLFVNSTAELANQNNRVNLAVTEVRDTMEAVFTDLIKLAQAEGEVKKNKNAAAIGRYLFASMQGLRITTMLDRKAGELNEMIDLILSVAEG